jgi:asparagine synthase (glutamine-hydrolysing)
MNDPYQYFSGLYGRSDSKEFLDRVFACDTEGYLPDCLLVKMDIASMANSLEARSPFLDHELMEFAARIPADLKVKRSGGKWILKEALKDFLPPEILHRRKMGFGIPLDKWFRGPLNKFLKDTLLSGPTRHRGFFQIRSIENLIKEHESGQRDHGYKLWSLLMFELWAQAYLDNKGIPESKSKGDGNS